MKYYHDGAKRDHLAELSDAPSLIGEGILNRLPSSDVGAPTLGATAVTAPISLRGQARLFWNVDQVAPDGPWPPWLPHYSGTLVINRIRFHVEGWRTENDAGRHVRLIVTSEPIHEGQWPQKE